MLLRIPEPDPRRTLSSHSEYVVRLLAARPFAPPGIGVRADLAAVAGFLDWYRYGCLESMLPLHGRHVCFDERVLIFSRLQEIDRIMEAARQEFFEHSRHDVGGFVRRVLYAAARSPSGPPDDDSDVACRFLTRVMEECDAAWRRR